MAPSIKQLIDKNKQAFDNNYYIESIHLSYVLLNKASKQIIKDELTQTTLETKVKFPKLIEHIKKEYTSNPRLKERIPKKVVRDLELFINLYKSINKEIKYQYPEKKITDTAQLGINCLVILNTNLIKIKNNKIA